MLLSLPVACALFAVNKLLVDYCCYLIVLVAVFVDRCCLIVVAVVFAVLAVVVVVAAAVDALDVSVDSTCNPSKGLLLWLWWYDNEVQCCCWC